MQEAMVLRFLRIAAVGQGNIFKVYLSTVRPVLAYVAHVSQLIPSYLSDRIESIQRRALRIIFPSADSYTEAQQLAQLDTLVRKRDILCINYMNKVPTPLTNSCPYALRKQPEQVYLFKCCETCRKHFSPVSIFSITLLFASYHNM